MTTLSFSTHFPKRMGGQPTNFVSKIWQGLLSQRITTEGDLSNIIICPDNTGLYANEKQLDLFNFKKGEHIPKLHTIRPDKKNRWKVGDKIHMVVFNRTKDRFQFAPVLEVKGIQEIEIDWIYGHHANIYINDSLVSLDYNTNENLAKNDGFDSVEHFFEWFNEDFHGKIIHWTGLTY